MAARLGVALGLLFVSAAAPACAQQLQRLHVRTLTLTADTAHPALEKPFDVTLTIRVAEKVARLQNVYLPAFVGPEELGDVREQSTGRSGTLYRETLRLVAHASGPLTIEPAFLDAIDARDGKPKRFISNELHLIAGAPQASLHFPPVAAMLVLLAALSCVVLLAVRARRFSGPRESESMRTPLPGPMPPSNALETALADLRARRDRGAVMLVRAALWHIAGATAGETLAAVLARPESQDERLRGMLVAVERAAFVEERALDRAIDDVLFLREPCPA